MLPVVLFVAAQPVAPPPKLEQPAQVLYHRSSSPKQPSATAAPSQSLRSGARSFYDPKKPGLTLMTPQSLPQRSGTTSVWDSMFPRN